jgi:uncharacterized Zn-finger protein
MLTLSNRNIIQNQTSDTNVKNLESLDGFPYKVQYRPNPKNGKMVVVYTCNYSGCKKEFLRTWNLLDHLRMHTGVRPYACQFCGKSFTQKGNMRKHLLQHYQPNLSQRRKYRCQHCDSSFTERYNYKVSYDSIFE